MSHLSFGSNINAALRMDSNEGVVGPLPRWQRTAREQGITRLPSSNENSFVNRSGLCITPLNPTPLSASFLLDSSLGSANNSKSPGRGVAPTRGKSPGRTLKLSVRQKTPTRNAPSTPKMLGEPAYVGDRFIPVRPTEAQMDRSHHLLMQQMLRDEGAQQGEQEEELTLQQREHRDKLAENLNDGQPLDQRIVHFSKMAPQTNSHVNSQKVLFSASKSSTSKAISSRHIPNVPERVLDAPDLMDDYYLHLIDWSSHNHLVVALGASVYVWNAGDGTINMLAEVEPPEYLCSLKWMLDGSILAVGLSSGRVQLWDASQQRLLRTMAGHEGRVGSLSWNPNTNNTGSALCSGGRTGQILHHDVRVERHVTSVVVAHSQEVCGLSWSTDGRLLASGGNDNIVNIWDGRTTPALHSLTDHQAAVKAVSWCPWQSNLLATGGGTADRTIRLWNANSGTCIKDVLTNSQVSSIVWNASYKELITAHGFTHNQLSIWKYPSFTKVADLTGHTGRVLEMVASPDGQMVASASADETIRLWKCWPTLAKEKKAVRSVRAVSSIAASLR